MEYNVLWIDDEHDKMNATIGRAKRNNIILAPFKSREKGMEELRANYLKYDAILLDAKFFSKESDAAGSEDTKASIETGLEIQQLPKKLDVFVLTGQAEAYENSTYRKMFDRVYEKGKDDDINKLFVDIVESAKKQPDTQLRSDYHDIFSVFEQGILDSAVEIQLVELLKWDQPTTPAQLKSFLSNIRSIQESIILKLEGIRVVPNANDTYSNIVKHLSGNVNPRNNFRPTSVVYQNEAIANLHKWLYFTCGTYIHNLNQQSYNDYMISRYTAESLRQGLLELLLWFKATYITYK